MTEAPIISVKGLSKVYPSGFRALDNVDLSIKRGEIFALLGPNGAGKTTLISILCGLVNPGEGELKVDGLDIIRDYRPVRKKIGLVPQELAVSMFESVWDTVTLTRGLYGRKPDNAYLEKLLRSLSLWDKKDSKIMALSGGMKRRVLIAKALSHQPQILFLDEPTAGVDVELRRDMWQMIRQLREEGVTIILTTHYIEEAEDMADRIGVINKGQIVLVEEKAELMKKLGKREMVMELPEPLSALPSGLSIDGLVLSDDGSKLVYTYDTRSDYGEIGRVVRTLYDHGIEFRDLQTSQSSLEEIFVSLVSSDDARARTAGATS
ncbi:multidrug ABC transporter ATP-binding protein [Pseudohongiella acticola]|uniref:Multidrug ABC transporter ATP-binding protein n=1 Tax=Pseudohongiella acticola TaxID=1524254 RepID=A0A1E8CKY7_9GAMM|nr:ABC transporter ATP-binding protein [Pseudohongiella acticola]OFE13146.1 multidrug ABC transporter ATP-binding protein [Pseudohongiella acticola]